MRLLAPLLLAHLAWRAARDGGPRYLRERLGLGERRPADETPPRWIHAASVGEVMTVLPLVEAELGTRAGERTMPGGGAPADGAGPGGTRTGEAASPVGTILVTTNTPSGAAVLARHAPPGVRHAYLPIDWPGATRRFLARERPVSGWIVETEIWPWLYARCHARGLPLSIVNARASARTTRHATGVAGAVYRRALAGVDVLARGADDAAGFAALGAEPARTQVVGELKFAAPRRARPPAPLERRYALAASTHADEERRLAAAWLDRGTDALLVIVPRHAERGTTLARELGALAGTGVGSGCRRRALGDVPDATERLYLADTLGELDAWYAHASGVFVGGSLIARGGHNVLEPARHARPIVVGPHTANFAAPMAALRAADAVAERADAHAVVAFLGRAFDGEPALARQGERARAVARTGERIVTRYLDILHVARAAERVGGAASDPPRP